MMRWLRTHFENIRVAVMLLFAAAALTITGFAASISVSQDDLCRQDQRQWQALHKVIIRATTPSPTFVRSIKSESAKIAYLARAHAAQDNLLDAQGPEPAC